MLEYFDWKLSLRVKLELTTSIEKFEYLGELLEVIHNCHVEVGRSRPD